MPVVTRRRFRAALGGEGMARGAAAAAPNMHGLAGHGVRFADMHSPSAACTPTRYGILTGLHCWRMSLKKGAPRGHSPNLIERGRLAGLLEPYQRRGCSRTV